MLTRAILDNTLQLYCTLYWVGSAIIATVGLLVRFGYVKQYLPPETSEHTQPSPQVSRPVLDLPTPEGWKAELNYVTGCIPGTKAQMVTHLSINRAAHGGENRTRNLLITSRTS